MFESKDKKRKFGSAYVAKRYDENHPEEHDEKNETPMQEHEETPEQEKKEKEENTEEHPVVKKHGKAHSIHIKHDHVAKKHHVMSQHEDGHTNESDHPTADEAHAEASKLAGIMSEQSPAEEPSAMPATHDEEGFPTL